jgi:hypothetical protein
MAKRLELKSKFGESRFWSFDALGKTPPCFSQPLTLLWGVFFMLALNMTYGMAGAFCKLLVIGITFKIK